MTYDDIWHQMTILKHDLVDLKATVDFQKRVLEMHDSRIAELKQVNKAGKEAPRVEEFKAVDAYRKSIEIVRSMKEDFWFRNIPNDVAKKWVTATIDDIINAIQNRIDRLEVK